MNQVNYQKKLDQLIEMNRSQKKVPTLFLHSCCAPCSSYVLEYLSSYFFVTVFFYNPNISPREEYEKRVGEIQRLIREQSYLYPVKFLEGVYEPERFFFYGKRDGDAAGGRPKMFCLLPTQDGGGSEISSRGWV